MEVEELISDLNLIPMPKNESIIDVPLSSDSSVGNLSGRSQNSLSSIQNRPTSLLAKTSSSNSVNSVIKRRKITNTSDYDVNGRRVVRHDSQRSSSLGQGGSLSTSPLTKTNSCDNFGLSESVPSSDAPPVTNDVLSMTNNMPNISDNDPSDQMKETSQSLDEQKKNADAITINRNDASSFSNTNSKARATIETPGEKSSTTNQKKANSLNKTNKISRKSSNSQ